MTDQFEPTVIGFTCNWCSYRAADTAGTARMKYAPNIRLIRLMCSGRLDPTFVFKAFADGADGVLISGCHPGDCHYVEQNFKALRRFILMKRVLVQMGVEPGRLKLLWASAAEGAMFAAEINKFVEEIRKLGPLNWGKDEGGRMKDEISSFITHPSSFGEEVPA
ncbi:MAG: hydrogenase iron-sulfur subunit [Anaerolineales bacterium]|nr:hydrogenase iron-sulfur subunit [Anaerolineales bacterium]